MKFYTYNDVKNIPKGTNFILLLIVENGDYIGLAHQNISYNIKPKHFKIEKYDFIVCTKVISVEGDYLTPIGYSNEDEWGKQEAEYKKEIMSIKSKIKDIIESYPYFVSIGLGNDWNRNVSLDKTLLLKLINEFGWEWYLEESYINDDIYSLIIEMDFSENEPSYIKELHIDGGEIHSSFAVYINKAIYDTLLKL